MGNVLALDQGTTSSRAIVFNQSGEILGCAQQEFQQYFPKPGWVEHDPQEIWESQLKVAREAISKAGVSLKEIDAIGIANQRETTIVWDRATGEAIYPAIVWQDRRTSDRCEELRDDLFEELVSKTTGLTLDPYFCATKIEWILNNVADARSKAEHGELLFGTVDSWLMWKLTKGSTHSTDVTNASRTLLWNLEDHCWDNDLLQRFKIPKSMMPEVMPSSSNFGKTDPSWFGDTLVIGGVAGDQQAALFGQSCNQPGLAKNTYGTGCFALMNVGRQVVQSRSRLLTTAICSGPNLSGYALEGSVFCGGSAVQWLRDGLGIIENASDVEALAASVDDTGDVYLVPAFTGLGAPHWDPYARGVIVGITRGTNRGHLARATLEGIAFQVMEVLEAMKLDMGSPIKELRVDGGASSNNLLMQIQADLLGVPVVRSKMTEATAFGAAFLAGLSTDVWNHVEELDSIHEIDRVFEPLATESSIKERKQKWAAALRKSKNINS